MAHTARRASLCPDPSTTTWQGPREAPDTGVVVQPENTSPDPLLQGTDWTVAWLLCPEATSMLGQGLCLLEAALDLGCAQEGPEASLSLCDAGPLPSKPTAAQGHSPGL